MPTPLTDFDWRVRAAVYRHFIDTGAAPAPAELAAAVTSTRAEPLDVRSPDHEPRAIEGGADSASASRAVAKSLARLAGSHLLVLWPRTGEIWMAHPFSGVQTDYPVRAAGRTWFANCAWDALGVPALLGLADSGTMAPCSDCGRSVRFGLRRGRPYARPAGAVVHFAVPPRRFWDDIGFT